MDVLHHLAQAAAFILLFQLFVVLLLFLGISGGLAFGLHWMRGKTRWAFGKADESLPKMVALIHTGTDYIAKPVIMGGGTVERVTRTVDALQSRVRTIRRGRSAPQPRRPVGARPVAPDSPPMPAASPSPTVNESVSRL